MGAILTGVRAVVRMIVTRIFLMSSDAEHLVIYLLPIWVSSLEKNVYWVHLFFNIVVYYFLLLSYMISLCILDVNPLAYLWLAIIFSFS